MPYQNYPDGLYLIKRKSLEKSVDHYAIWIVGRRLNAFKVDGRFPVLFHQTNTGLRIDGFQHTGTWEVVGKIVDEAGAVDRMMHVANYNPQYELLSNNCEQIARYVATGKHESTQVQGVFIFAGLVAAAVLIARL